MGIHTSSGTVFGWFANMTAVTGLMTWFGICVTYLRFYKGFAAQGLDRSNLPYASNLQPFAAWYGVIACPCICFVRENHPLLYSTKTIILSTVQRMDSLPQRQLGHCHISDELFAFHTLSRLVHR